MGTFPDGEETDIGERGDGPELDSWPCETTVLLDDPPSGRTTGRDGTQKVGPLWTQVNLGSEDPTP